MKDYNAERERSPDYFKSDFTSKFWRKVSAQETANVRPGSLFGWLTLRRAAVFASAAVVLLAVILLLTIPSEPKLTSSAEIPPLMAGDEMDIVANLELLESIQDVRAIEISVEIPLLIAGLEHMDSPGSPQDGETDYLADIIELASAAD
ncbi:MAG: hypothetical protein HY762_00430 [Planctomycetes bacterium]|nr:hypothetical protein [Planctomycetota bacterium]